MGKKLDLSISTPTKVQSYGAYTKGYRQSDNVEDRRGASAKEEAELLMDSSLQDASTSTRKVAPEEAIRRTHTER